MKLYYRQRWPEKPPRALVVGVHGYAEHGRRYDEIEDLLVGNGFAFRMMDNRGHGYSQGRRGHINRFDEFVEDLHAFVADLRERNPGQRVFLLGHSNGSLISIRYALKYQDELAGLVLSGAALRAAVPVPKIELMLMPVISKYLPAMMFNAHLDPAGLSHDPEVVRKYADDPMIYRVISGRFAAEMFGAMADSLKRASEIRIPTLMMHGAEDPACDPAAAKEFFERLGAADKTLHVYPGMFHEVFNEVGKERVLADMTSWMNQRA